MTGDRMVTPEEIETLKEIARLAWRVVDSSELEVSYRIRKLDRYFNHKTSEGLWEWIIGQEKE